MPDSQVRRFRSFVVEGKPFHLVEDPEVRARDLVAGRITVVSEQDGRVLEVAPSDLLLPPLEGVAPPGDLYALRPFVEEVLALGFDDRWLAMIVSCVARHRLLAPEVSTE